MLGVVSITVIKILIIATLICFKIMNTLNNNADLNNNVIFNLSNIRLRLLMLPILILLGIVFFLLKAESLSVVGYSGIQKDSFLYINAVLSKAPVLQQNLTQLGDILISFSLLSIFILYAPKLWETLLTSSILSLLVSALLKRIFAVPRPAAVFDNESFTIIGSVLKGHTSLPSGHSIATFVVVTTLLFAFKPTNKYARIVWYIAVLAIGLGIAFTRVGVGAHYPLDVIIGSILGYMLTILGISINNKWHLWSWIKKPKFYIVFIILFLLSGKIIIDKIVKDNLFIYYLSLISLIITLYLIVKTYVKKKY